MTAEHTRIAWLRQRFGTPPAPALGIGDDAALLPGADALVATVDAAVEGVHFRRDLCTLEEASARAVEAAASDVAAMGARLEGPGTGLLLAWTLPPDFPDADLRALAEGAARAAARLQTPIVGGNLTAGPALTLTTTVLGRAAGPVLTRAGARPGDCVAVAGTPGLAGLGLRALLAGRGADAALLDAVRAWRAPQAQLALGAPLVGRAHAAIDLSDGLGQDSAHLARASGVAVVLDATALGALPALQGPSAALGLDPCDAALTGGEDYLLCATGPAAVFLAPWRIVGAIEAGEGVWLTGRDGRRRIDADPALQGWDHFRDAGSDVSDRGR